MALYNTVRRGWHVLSRLLPACVAIVSVGCGSLQPLELPDEYSAPPVESELWSQLAAVRSDDRLHLLNTGSEAIDWRLRLIDSASQSLDLQTFLWKFDQTGLTVMRHIYEAADRGGAGCAF